MTRIARVVMPDMAHHITQRGIRRSNVFLDELDRQTYPTLFIENSRRFQLQVLAYCLMTNHVHFVAVPKRRDSIWKTFQNWLRNGDDTAEMDRFIRESTFTGQPCGNEDFVQLVGNTLQRELGKKKPGPKPKPSQDGTRLWASDKIRK
jgi:REP element-mobilizing transposase RayT